MKRFWRVVAVAIFTGVAAVCPSGDTFAEEDGLDGAMQVLSLNPWSDGDGVTRFRLNPLDLARHAEALRQLIVLAVADDPLEFHWVEVQPRHYDRDSEWPDSAERFSAGMVVLRFDMASGAAKGDRIPYEWRRPRGFVSGGSPEARRQDDLIYWLSRHPTFVPTEFPEVKVAQVRSGILGLRPGHRKFPEAMEYAMSMPETWRPVVETYFSDRKNVEKARAADLLASLAANRGPSAADGMLSQAFRLLRLRDMTLTADEKATLTNLTPPDGDLIVASLWMSQWMIASYAHENPDDLGKRLDALVDAKIANDKKVSRSVFMMLVAAMASRGYPAGFVTRVPFVPFVEPDLAASQFFVDRVNHIRDSVSKLPKDSLSDWGKSIANYQFEPPYSPWPPEPAKERTPKE